MTYNKKENTFNLYAYRCLLQLKQIHGVKKVFEDSIARVSDFLKEH